MKKISKIIVLLSIIIIALSLSLFILFQIKINSSINSNKIILNRLDKITKDKDTYVDDNILLTTLEINNIDYIGYISIDDYDLALPIKNICSNDYFDISSACLYSKKDNLVILGTNLKNSFYNYKNYNVSDKLSLTTSLGIKLFYTINSIEVVDNIKDELSGDLVIIIKNYYDMKYVLLKCLRY